MIAEMAILTPNEWQKGTTLTISFMDGSDNQRNMVKQMAAKWLPFIDLKFNFIDTNDSMIRISFVHDAGSWSYIGTECFCLSLNEPTMNFGWLRDETGSAEWEKIIFLTSLVML